MSTDAVRTFVVQLRQAQLLEPTQQQEAERLGQTATRPAELAGELVRRGWMTPYQANQVARGRGAELLLGSYLVLEPLARGGMGQVFKARHRYLQRLVALKFIRPEQRDSQDTVQRFQREVRLLAELRHPHIVQAHDAGNVGDAWFLAMELLEGVNLDQLVQRSGPLPVGQACLYLRQAGLGLQHAHERGLVHRDIKPSNLFLTAEGIKLLDLGLARTQALGEGCQPGDLTRANTVMGTPDYLAPEQALDPRRADARSDLYSLGCTLFFLLTGRPPFPQGTLAQKLLYHQQTAPPPVEALRADVPPAAAELLRRLLAKAPQQRPASAAEVATYLAPLAASAVPAVLAAAPTGVRTGPSTQPGATAAAAPSPSSLIDAQAPGPQRGFTLMTDSLAPTPQPSLAHPEGGSYERGWTLPVESLPPAVRAAPVAVAVSPAPAAPPLASRRRPLIGLGLLAGAACGGALLLLLVAFALGWFSSPAPPRDDAPLAQGQRPPSVPEQPATKPGKPPDPVAPTKTEKPTEPVKAAAAVPPKEIADLWSKVPAPQVLGPMGRDEQPDIPAKPFDVDPALLNQPPFRKVFLSDLQEFADKGHPPDWKFAKNGRLGDPNNSVIQVNGSLYLKGLGTHPPFGIYTRVCYALGKRVGSLHGAVGFGDDKGFWSPKPTRFVILADGKVRWRSQALSQRGVSEAFHLDVRDVQVLELRVYAEHPFSTGCHAAWLDPFVIVGPSPATPGQAPGPVPPPQPAQRRPEPLNPEGLPGLIAYWPLDEGQGKSAGDKSGHNLPARIHSGEWVPGVKGSALRLNGISDFVDLGGSPRLNFAAGAPFTLAGWFATEADVGMICSFRNRTAGFPVINLAVRNGRLHGWVRDDTSGFGGAQINGGPVKDGQWHHVALLRHPDGTIELFLDRTLQGRAKGKSSGGAITTDLRALGSERFLVSTGKQGATYFAGRVDEFCVFNRALALQEIAVLANSKKQ